MPQFRAKARAIELLGKGQIADLPTAITELWKNGYDAYAKNLDCKLYLDSYKDNHSPLFILSDDGFGMTEQDLLDKWLVLGTDSKSRGEKIPEQFGLPSRPPMGEKGIGRLSVAYLGNIMLMLTKKVDRPVQCLFIDWRVLENYDLYLDDLELPIFTFSSADSFIAEFNKSKEKFSANFAASRWKEQPEIRKNVLGDISDLKVNHFLAEEILNPFLDNDYHGTTFIVFNPHEQLLELSSGGSETSRKDITVRYIRTSLAGIHNDLNGSAKDFETHFYIYDNAGRYDLIDAFFTKEEMRKADHWLRGKFDETGFFEGELRIYNQIFPYAFRPNRPPGLTSYGPLSIEWGFMEGVLKNSLLNEEEYNTIEKKLDQFGGLYIYRDNFRVLPYGRPDADFLEFETRRSKRAGEYFFSHRRFLGYIDISREGNPNLKDKAGREGFIQSKAYRDFRDDLIAFFVDIAFKYLRPSANADETTSREAQLKEIQERFEKQKEAEKRKNAKTKKAFLENIINNQNGIETLLQDLGRIYDDLLAEVAKAEINYNSYNRLLMDLDDKRSKYRSLKMSAPRATKFTKKQDEAYDRYQEDYINAGKQIEECLEVVEQTRKRVNVENLRDEYEELFETHIKRIEQNFQGFMNDLKNSYDRIRDDVKTEKDSYVNDFIERTGHLKINDDDSKEIITDKIRGLDGLIEEQGKVIQETIGGFINHIKSISIDVDDDYLRSWYKEQNEKLEKRLQDYEELAQLGISIEIIDHQFNVMYSQMKDSVLELERYSGKYPEIKQSINQLKGSFQHLEGNYKLLTPLYRTSRRTRAIITGKEIEDYIGEFFKNEFNNYRIDFSVNAEFKEYEFFTYDSIIKPVFLNIINNANYWLISSKDRRIRIERNGDEISIMNSGQRVDDRYLEDIFTLFFTRKKDGRGIGLYLAKKNLNSIGYDIYATNDRLYNKLNGACFVIKKKSIYEPEAV
jgi:signal transduction histidine kinase